MNRADKPKKTANELVDMLKNEKGITFDIMTEAEAVNYFRDINNYLRTASYRKITKNIKAEKMSANILT